MKSSSSKLLIAFTCTLLGASPCIAFAKAAPIAVGSLRAKSFDADPVVMLPGNPFYGIIGTFDLVKESVSGDKLTTRTALLNRYAARLVRTFEVNAKDERLVLRALKDYQGAAYQYAMMITRLDEEAFSDEVVDQVSMTFATHLRLVDEAIEWKPLTNAHKAILSDVSERLTKATVAVLEERISAEVFADILTTDSSEKALVEKIRTAEVINLVAKAAARVSSNDVATALLEKRSVLLSTIVQSIVPPVAVATTMMVTPAETRSFKAELAASTVSATSEISELKQFAGSSAERLQTVLFLLDTPSLRDNQDLIDLKNLLLIRAF